MVVVYIVVMLKIGQVNDLPLIMVVVYLMVNMNNVKFIMPLSTNMQSNTLSIKVVMVERSLNDLVAFMNGNKMNPMRLH